MDGQGRGTGTVGIAPRARILPVTVGSSARGRWPRRRPGSATRPRTAPRSSTCPSASGVTSPARCDPVLQAAVAYALGRNAVLIASAGNSNLFPGTGGAGPPARACSRWAAPSRTGGCRAGGAREPYVAVAARAGHMVYVGRDSRVSPPAREPAGRPRLTAAGGGAGGGRPHHALVLRSTRPLTGTATPAGHPVPDGGYGYGIVNLARAVNASAYPVRASAANRVLGPLPGPRLATPAGRAAAARYRLARPGQDARAASGISSQAGGLRLRLPVGEMSWPPGPRPPACSWRCCWPCSG